MERLTYKVNDSYYVKEPRHLYEDTWELVQKLGAIEDLLEKYQINDIEELEIMQENKKYKEIEEELGIDLITLFKALNSCWFKYNFEIIGDIRPSLRFINGEWCLISNIERIAFPYPLRLYGKIWSLDRSKLEND